MTILAFFLPFLHLPSSSSAQHLNEGQISLHTMVAVLKLIALMSNLSLSAALPLFLARVPCLSSTSPVNLAGGKLGALTDLSIFRLLNALDPDPVSESGLGRSDQGIDKRALPSTNVPSINSAKTRLIVLLVIIAVLSCGGGLFVIARTHAALSRYKNHFHKNVCGGLDMAIVSTTDAAGWKGLSEETVKRWLTKRAHHGQEDKLEIVGVSAIPLVSFEGVVATNHRNTSSWRDKIKCREAVLHKLEEAEMKYIESFKGLSNGMNGARSDIARDEARCSCITRV